MYFIVEIYGSFKLSADKYKNLLILYLIGGRLAKPTCFTTNWSPKLARTIHLMSLAKDLKRENMGEYLVHSTLPLIGPIEEHKWVQ